MDKIAELFTKIIDSKKINQILLSIVIGCVIYYKTPCSNEMLIKLTNNGYYIFVTILTYLVIHYITILFIKIKNYYYKIKNSKSISEQLKAENTRKLNEFLNSMDNLKYDQRNEIFNFIISRNQPKRINYFYHDMRYEQFFDVSDSKNGWQIIRLKEDFYNCLLEIYTKTGMISHFKDDFIVEYEKENEKNDNK